MTPRRAVIARNDTSGARAAPFLVRVEAPARPRTVYFCDLGAAWRHAVREVGPGAIEDQTRFPRPKRDAQ